mmetsp:Transcript_15642/g.18838  ORF Transcript_15642/g.18838 Transcript_15642/m.18838 type:complete len:210 (+) Transcript_15642:408-1037(+)
MCSVDLLSEDGYALHTDTNRNTRCSSLYHDFLQHGTEQFDASVHRAVRGQNRGFGLFWDMHSQPMDEAHRLFPSARRECEDDTHWRRAFLLAQITVIVDQLDHRLGVVNCLRNEPSCPHCHFAGDGCVLISLLQVSLCDRHSSPHHAFVSADLRRLGHSRPRVLSAAGGASDQVQQVNTSRTCRGLINPVFERLSFVLSNALIHDRVFP